MPGFFFCQGWVVKLGVVVHTCELSTQGVDSGESNLQDHPRLCSKFEASLGYVGPITKNAS